MAKKVKVCGSCDEALVLCECSIGCVWECHNPDCYFYFYDSYSSPPVEEREVEEGEENGFYYAWDGC